jgi:hypothetical protein
VTATAKTSAAAISAGVGAEMLGDLAGLTWQGWAVLTFVVALSVIAGALARQGQYEAKRDVTPELVKKSRRYALMIILAQMMGGFCAAAAAGANVWATIPACLLIGWTGARFLNEIEKRIGGKSE